MQAGLPETYSAHKIFAEKLLKMLDKAMINLYNYFVAGTGLTF